jgi:hypothetical protein
VSDTLRSVTTARRLHHSYADYLAALEVSGVKLEYCEGEIYAVAGGTPERADLAAAMIRLLGNALLGNCRVSSRVELDEPRLELAVNELYEGVRLDEA